jgi:undecaprenyl-diphosphatase
MTWVSEMLIWVPLYLFFLWLIQRRFGWKGLAWCIPVIALMIFCSDSGSVALFKNTVQRLRPCHIAHLRTFIHLVPADCGGQYGFVSSHAANHLAIAAFMSGVLKGLPRWGAFALYAWALLICYSRVYLGVHFPGDVLVGGLYGFILGWIFFRIFRSLLVRGGIKT